MNFRSLSMVLLVAVFLICTLNIHAQENESSDKTWQARAQEIGLSESDISALEKNRLLIADETHKQIFSAYQSASNPLFITSDSLLNAYHVLYEESVFHLEKAMAARFPGIIRHILSNLQNCDEYLTGRPDLVSASKKRALLVTGIALGLVDDSFGFDVDGLDEILEQETGKIIAAKEVAMPKWLGKPDETFTALDYKRYKVRGFYTRSEQLGRYFRAMAWLQSIPFRVGEDEELLAMLMLGSAAVPDGSDESTGGKDLHLLFRSYKAFIGTGDDWDLLTAAQLVPSKLRMDLDGDALHKQRGRLRKKAADARNGSLINDQIRIAPEDGDGESELQFRIVSAYRTPGSILFQQTTNPRRLQRFYPDGLEIAISLGSNFARKGLEDSQKQEVLEIIESCQRFFEGRSLYFRYLNALRALVDDPEYDAPDFMKNTAWQAKSCNTVLAGWAQLKHTWALQSKQTVHYLGMRMLPAGFVEPDPEFFSRMADLAEATKLQLDMSGAFEPDYTRIIRSIEKFRAFIDGIKNEDDFSDKLSELPQEELMDLEFPYMLMEASPSEAEKGTQAYFKEKAKWLDALADDIREGRFNRYPRLEETLKVYNFDLESLWENFESVSRRLELIAHKQLRGAELNKSETAFIKSYGSEIAYIMFYGASAYMNPRDDAPRVIDVYSNPDRRGYLHVGVARPRTLYVLYPWQDNTVLCEGAVMPYYEFLDKAPLTDAEWKEKLDSATRPPIPKWLSPVVSGGNLSRPDR